MKKSEIVQSGIDISDLVEVGDYCISSEGIEKISNVLLNAKPENILVVDELGPLEIVKKGGLWPAMKKILKNEKKNIIITVRSSMLAEFLNMVGNVDKKVFSIERGNTLKDLIFEITETIYRV